MKVTWYTITHPDSEEEAYVCGECAATATDSEMGIEPHEVDLPADDPDIPNCEACGKKITHAEEGVP